MHEEVWHQQLSTWWFVAVCRGLFVVVCGGLFVVVCGGLFVVVCGGLWQELHRPISCTLFMYTPATNTPLIQVFKRHQTSSGGGLHPATSCSKKSP